MPFVAQRMPHRRRNMARGKESIAGVPQRHAFVNRSVVCMGLAAIIAISTAAPAVASRPASPFADLPQPKNIACQGWESDTVKVTWADEAPDETEWRVERNVAGGGWSQVATFAAD